MWTQLFGVYSCPSLFKLQFILGQTENFVLPGKSVQEIIQTVVSSDSEAHHWPNWNYWYYYDWLAAAQVERDDSANWQGCSACNRKNPRLFWLSAVSGRDQSRTREENFPGVTRNSRMQTRRTMGRSCWEYDDQLCRDRTSYIPCYQCMRKRRIEKQRWMSEIDSLQRLRWNHRIDSSNNYISVRSVSTEQWRICVVNWPETHEVRRNPPRMGIWIQWLCRQNFRQLIKFFSLMPKYKETCCVNMRRKFAELPEQEKSSKLSLQCWFLAEHWERTILHYTWWWCNWQIDGIMSREYILLRSEESFQVRGWIRGKRGSAQSWMWWSVIIKDVTMWKSWSNLYFVTELILGFESWM